MDLGLAGKVAVVTGASKGIGLAITTALAQEGVVVVAGARKPSSALIALTESGQVDFVEVDLGTAQGAADLVEAASLRGPLDILVNNVGGVSPRLGGFLEVTDEQWLFSLTMNLMAAVRVTRAALPGMLDAGRGSIVTNCSINARLPDPLVIDYSASKAALSNFCKSLSKEMGPRGIRVNTVSPGPVTTDLWLGETGMAESLARQSGRDPAEVAANAAADSVTNRFTSPAEIADLVLFLASDRAGNITGADFAIDGGMITTI